MDSRVRNLTIFIVVSIILLAFGLVALMNKEDKKKPTAAVSSQPEEVAENSYLDFLKDDTFFDKEVSVNSVSINTAKGDQLYMLATSVSHDIRLVITDEAGNPVRGQSFNVEVDNDEYKDLDKDGMIKITDLNAGEYYVSLKPIDGYSVPTEPMRVTVKDSLEFATIDDISYYIYTEDQINPESEDTAEEPGDDDIDDTENSDLLTTEGEAFGIDVSKWQKSIDWYKVKDSGVDFAIIRCGYRGSATGVLVEDPYFEENIKGAKEAGIEVGVYFFTQATSEMEAVEEASMCISLLQDYDIDLPVYIDSEKAGGAARANGLDKATRTAVCQAFCKTMESAGYKSGVYASRSWLYNNLDASALSDYSIWDAEYREKPIYTGDFDIWQYTSKGMIDGINTKVDLDIKYK